MLSIINFCIKNLNSYANNVHKLSQKAEICSVMMLYTCVHTLFICVVHLSSWSVRHTRPQGSVMENVLICVALVLKQHKLSTNTMHNNGGVY